MCSPAVVPLSIGLCLATPGDKQDREDPFDETHDNAGAADVGVIERSLESCMCLSQFDAANRLKSKSDVHFYELARRAIRMSSGGDRRDFTETQTVDQHRQATGMVVENNNQDYVQDPDQSYLLEHLILSASCCSALSYSNVDLSSITETKVQSCSSKAHRC